MMCQRLFLYLAGNFPHRNKSYFVNPQILSPGLIEHVWSYTSFTLKYDWGAHRPWPLEWVFPSLSLRQLDPSPAKTCFLFENGKYILWFSGAVKDGGGLMSCCLFSPCWHHAVGILLIRFEGDIIPLLYCFHAAIADTHCLVQCGIR